MTDPLTYVLVSLKRAADNAYPWSLTPTEAGALVAEVDRLRAVEREIQDLRMQRDEHLLDNRHAFAEGVSTERADVIEWLTEAQFHVVLREEVGVIAKLKRQFHAGLHVRHPKEKK